MKKITFFLIGLVISFSAFAQSQRSTEIFNEDFSSGVPPTGWTIDGIPSQWSQEASANAGGTAPEAKLLYVSGTNTTRLISPVTDLTGVSEVLFSFKHFLDDYSGTGYAIGVATRSGGGAWTDAWTVNPTGNMGPESRDILISGGDVGASDFQVCIYLSGNTFNFDNWFIDDLVLSQPDSDDLTLESIDMDAFAAQGDVEIKCTVKNVGLNNATSFDLNYQVDGGDVVTENVDGVDLQTADGYNHTFATAWSTTPGDYTLDVWVSNFNGNGDDDDTSNDGGTKALSIATDSRQNLPFYESFTSSTCGPCAPFNTNVFNPFMDEHPNDINVLKYQMSWPGAGDPYYTEEGGVRRNYYGVTFVPDLYTGGNQTGTNAGEVTSAFDYETNKPAFFEMTSTLTVDGDNVEVSVEILPFISVDMKVNIAIVEKITTENTASNGETQFENVMMKMLPDASGTLVSFEAEVPVTINETYDMSTTFVEEMDDLMLIAFVQDDNTKQVMQSTFNEHEPVLGVTDNSLENISLFPNPSNGYLNFNATKDLNVAIYDVLGKEVHSGTVRQNEELNLTQLNNGLYLVRINDGVNVSSKKLIINK